MTAAGLPFPLEKLTSVERKLFGQVWDAGWDAHDAYTRAALANSSGLRGDGEPLEPTPKPVNPYLPP